MRKTYTVFAFIAFLAACTSPNYTNLVHPDHPATLQRVNTPEKAAAFFANSTQIFKTGNGMVLPIGTQDGEPVFPETGYSIEYFSADRTVYAAIEGNDRIEIGRWSIKQSGRGYPRLCRSFPIQTTASENQTVMSEWDCLWPAGILKPERTNNGIYRGDVLNLRSRRFPSALRTIESGASVDQFLQRLGLNTANLTDLKALE